MILHTHFLLHLYLILLFFVLPIAHIHKIQIREKPKLAKPKKKTEEETFHKGQQRRHRRLRVYSQDRELFWLGCSAQLANLLKGFS